VILIWAVAVGGAAWAYGLVALLVIAIGQVVKYAIPGRALADAGVPNRTLGIAAIIGVVGFFTVPVIGLPLGFVGGAYLAERFRVGTHPDAWRSTRHALVAVGWSMLIELGSLLIAAAIVAAGGALT
jgi:hypothetical protein